MFTMAINNGVTNKGNSPLVYLTFVLGCLVMVLLLVNVYFFMLLGIGHASNAPDKPDESEKKVTTRPVCTTKECVEISATILGKIDWSVNPCVDMYQFACGQHNSKESTPLNIPTLHIFVNRFKEDISKILSSHDTRLYGRESSALAKMKKYHRLCTDEERISVNFKSKILQLISDAGSWTLTEENVKPFESSTWSLQKTLVKMNKMDVWPLIKVEVVKRWREVGSSTPEHFIALNVGKWSSFETGIYDEKKIEELAHLTAALGGDPLTVRQKIKQVLEFSTELISAQNHDRFPKEYEFHPSYLISIKTFQIKLGSWLNLKEYLSDLFDGTALADDMLLAVQAPQYFIDVHDIFKKYDKKVHANYLMLWLLHSFNNILPTSWQKRKLDSRERRCTENTLTLFGLAAKATYVEHVFRHENKAMVNSVAQNVRQQMLATIDRTTWLEEPLRKKLLEKAQDIDFFCGYSDWIIDAKSLDDYYANFEVVDDELLNATTAAMREVVKKLYKGLTETRQ